MERMKIAQFLGNLGERKLLSSTLVLFTLAIGIIIGTMISTNVDAAREGKAAAPDAKPLKIPDPVETRKRVFEDRQAVASFGRKYPGGSPAPADCRGRPAAA